jgi:hypothetical protein
VLTIPEIFDVIRGKLQVPRAESKRKELLLRFILEHASSELLEKLKDEADHKELRCEERLAARCVEGLTAWRGGEEQREEQQEARDTTKYLELPKCW